MVDESVRDQGRSRRVFLKNASLLVLVVTVVALGVVAFVAAQDDVSGSASPGGVSVAPENPDRLVGTWWPPESSSLDGWLVAFGPTGELGAFDEDCAVEGEWRGSTAAMVTVVISGAGGRCDGVLDQSLDWFPSLQWFTVDHESVLLLDKNGDLIVRLEPANDEASWPASAADSSLIGDMDETYRSAVEPIDLPEEAQPPERSELTAGQWRPINVPATGDDLSSSAKESFVRFDDRGFYEGSDGCNGQFGSWALDPHTGHWLAMSGVTTLMGCANIDINGVLYRSIAVGVVDGELVFFDHKGAETARFEHEN